MIAAIVSGPAALTCTGEISNDEIVGGASSPGASSGAAPELPLPDPTSLLFIGAAVVTAPSRYSSAIGGASGASSTSWLSSFPAGRRPTKKKVASAPLPLTWIVPRRWNIKR